MWAKTSFACIHTLDNVLITMYYVTEKFYRCLLTGSVPLVLEYKGMPNYAQFAPYRNSYINMADFKT